MKPHKIGAAALAAALLCAPCLPIRAAVTPPAPRTVAQQDTPPDVEQALFSKGQALYNQGRYEQAADVLSDFLKTYPNSIITDLTLLWLGRSYIAMGRLPDAEQVATRLRAIKDTPFTDIYEEELVSARREIAARAPLTPQPTPQTARPTATPRNVTITGTQSVAANAQPSPTPTRVGNTPRVRPTPTPRATPTPQVAQTNPALVGPAPTDNTPTINTPRTTGRRPSRRATERRGNPTLNTNQQTALNSTPPVVRPTPTVSRATPPVVRPTPRATPVPTPLPTPTPSQVATVRPTPTRIPPPDTSTMAASPATSAPGGGDTGIVLTVRQVPNLALALRRASLAASPGQAVQLPVTVTNMGNKEDQFRLETDLPAEYQPTFSLAAGGQDTGLPILITPQLARGQSLDVLLNLRVPEAAGDQQQRPFVVRAASKSDYQVFRVASGGLTVVAAALAGSAAVSRESVQPGETFTQTIAVRNQGSAPARNARADFVFSPDFELVSADPAPLVYDRDSRTAVWNLGDLDARDTRNISVSLRAVNDALAANRPVGRGTMRTSSLPTASNFDGPAVEVGRVPKARIDAVSTGLTATPGDSLFVPFVVRNPGNYAESYDLRVTAPNAPQATLYADTNGDGQHQDAEPIVAQTAALEPRTGQYPLLLRVDVPRQTPDGQQFAYNIVSRALATGRVASEANTVITVATPRVRVRTEQVTDVANPGDLIYYRLVLVNEGGGLAKNLVVTEVLPEALQFAGSEPSLDTADAAGGAHRVVWRVAELAPGDTAVLRITARLGANLQADADVRTRRTLTYQDTNGNAYSQGQ